MPVDRFPNVFGDVTGCWARNLPIRILAVPSLDTLIKSVEYRNLPGLLLFEPKRRCLLDELLFHHCGHAPLVRPLAVMAGCNGANVAIRQLQLCQPFAESTGPRLFESR
jgi:hypothetical protein